MLRLHTPPETAGQPSRPSPRSPCCGGGLDAEAEAKESHGPARVLCDDVRQIPDVASASDQV